MARFWDSSRWPNYAIKYLSQKKHSDHQQESRFYVQFTFPCLKISIVEVVVSYPCLCELHDVFGVHKTAYAENKSLKIYIIKITC